MARGLWDIPDGCTPRAHSWLALWPLLVNTPSTTPHAPIPNRLPVESLALDFKGYGKRAVGILTCAQVRGC